VEPRPKRRIPRIVMFAVPAIFLGLVLFLVSVAYSSNKAARSSPSPSDVATVVVATDEFLTCTDCHGDLDKVFKDGKLPELLFTHDMHFGKGVSDCSVCHVPDTHVPDRINKPTMSRCFTCHGTTKTSIVRSTCETCHPPGIEQKPTTHLTSTWLPDGHAKAAREDQFGCLTCHKQSFCETCHGTEMPHPEGWTTEVHAVAYFDNPAVCQQCHPRVPDQPDFCDTCHHPAGPEDVAWREFHPTAIANRGASNCFQCHSDQTCRTCHTKGREDFSADEALLESSEPAPGVTTPPTPEPSPSA